MKIIINHFHRNFIIPDNFTYLQLAVVAAMVPAVAPVELAVLAAVLLLKSIYIIIIIHTKTCERMLLPWQGLHISGG